MKAVRIQLVNIYQGSLTHNGVSGTSNSLIAYCIRLVVLHCDQTAVGC